MATSLIVPIAYITVLVTGLAIFSRVYRRRKAAEKTTWEAWFPTHPARDTYISLLSSDQTVPDSLLKSALLVRATADVKRIWRLRDDKAALTSLHTRGLVGDDTMARFGAAEKELEAEIVDVVSEANTFRQGWGGMIFQTATEMAHAERTRETVLNIPKIKEREEKKMLQRRRLLGEPMPQKITIKGGQPEVVDAAASTPESTQQSTPSKTGSTTPADVSPAAVQAEQGDSPQSTSNPGSGANTPSKNTPGKKKKGKK